MLVVGIYSMIEVYHWFRGGMRGGLMILFFVSITINLLCIHSQQTLNNVEGPYCQDIGKDMCLSKNHLVLFFIFTVLERPG